MSNFHQQIDRATVDYHIRRAHAERAEALAHAFATAGRQIKNLFSSPDTGTLPTGCGSNA